MDAKEQFKLKIIRQLNEPEPNAFQYLCLDQIGFDRIYRQHTALACSEFKVDVLLERIDKSGRFGVAFVDWERGHVVQPGQVDLSNKKAFEERTYYCEQIDIENDGIRFSLEVTKLEISNYEMRLWGGGFNWIELGEIDFKAKEARSGLDDFEVQHFIRQRNSPMVTYFDYRIDSETFRKLQWHSRRIDWSFGTDFTDKLKSLFDEANSDRELSPMMHILLPICRNQ